LPANTFHFQGHGELREGNWADIVIFVPDKIQDNSTYLDPHHYATGIPYVLVNGIPVIKNGEHRREGRSGFATRLRSQVAPRLTRPASCFCRCRETAPGNGCGKNRYRLVFNRKTSDTAQVQIKNTRAAGLSVTRMRGCPVIPGRDAQ
jgi:hypothetical protein